MLIKAKGLPGLGVFDDKSLLRLTAAQHIWNISCDILGHCSESQHEMATHQWPTVLPGWLLSSGWHEHADSKGVRWACRSTAKLGRVGLERGEA